MRKVKIRGKIMREKRKEVGKGKNNTRKVREKEEKYKKVRKNVRKMRIKRGKT